MNGVSVEESVVPSSVAVQRRHSSPSIVIEARHGLLNIGFGSLWQYRELLYFLVWRDIKVRYKQTVIGIAWVALQPVLTMIVFSLVFGRFAKIPSDGTPYPLFVFSALLPWNLFASSLGRGGDSVVQHANLISKVYFPRLVLPVAGMLSPLIDFGVAFLILMAIMVSYGVSPGAGVLALPLFVLLAMLTAFAVSLWTAALNVRYRDVGHAIPFLIQLWMFVSPVAYPMSIIPERWRVLYSLNPMTGVIEGFRWALLGGQLPDVQLIAVSALAITMLLVPGAIYFRHTERTFADLV
jgi:lipopolysaccharide transport system permease protein